MSKTSYNEWIGLNEAFKLMQFKDEEIRLLKAEIRMLKAKIEAQQFDISRLMRDLNTPAPERSTVPLYVTETEEDVRFQRDAGLISKREAEDMLAELAFDDPNILFEDDSPYIT